LRGSTITNQRHPVAVEAGVASKQLRVVETYDNDYGMHAERV